ncbi:MAG: hypothetical protein IT336_09190 [Thermomicrobiales bacterium]|nr:hypothetical protein [Thermomicrobiales bacterium]
MSLFGGSARQVAAAEPRCQVEHRSPAAIVESAGSGDTSVPLPDPVPYIAPEGVAATPETVERVVALMETLS